MYLKLFLSSVGGLLVAFILGVTGGPAIARDVNRVVMATGTLTSGYYLLGGGICAQVNAAGGLRCAVETSKGTVANLQALRAGQVDVILAQSDWQHHAYAGSAAPFSGDNAIKDMRALMSLTGSPLVILARADANIANVEALAGKSMDIGKPATARRAAMDDVLAALGWDLGQFKLASELSEAEAIKSLCGGKLDAIALAGTTPDRDVTQAMRACAVRIVPITGAVVDKLIVAKPYYSTVPIQKGSYPEVKADVPSIGLRVILLASGKVTENDAYAMVKSVAANLDAVRKLHTSFSSIDRAALAKAGISAPLHAGAAKYYREAK
jgi:TRAP transporter TAXI family solute receptor